MPSTVTSTSLLTRLSVDQLTAQLSAKQFSYCKVTPDVEQIFIGHKRAKEALEFGLSMDALGFNIFAIGEHGTGRQT